MSLFFLAQFVLFFYAAGSLLLFTPHSWLVKAILAVPLLVGSCKYLIYNLLGGSFFAPVLPRTFLFVMESLYNALLCLVFMLLVKDLTLLVLAGLRRLGVVWSLPLSTGIFKLSLVVLALAMGAWGFWQSTRVPHVRDLEITSAKIPPALDGVSIVQLTDTHIGSILQKDWLETVVAQTNALHPDLILLTGDYIDGTVDKLATELLPLADLRAKYGVFGVTGNHEYYWNAPEWLDFLTQQHIVMLHNAHQTIEINGAKLVIVGLPDLNEERFYGTGADLQKALDNAPEAFRILLEHQPRNAADYAPYVDLQLAGHTHGGMTFFLQPLIALFNSGFVKGLYQVGQMQLYVSPGTGLWGGFSCRIGVPAEITRLILRSQP